MQIHKLAKIERCVSADKTRYTLTQPYLDDGHVVLEIPVESQGRYKGQVLNAIVVRPSDKGAVKGAFGLVMPVRLD